MNPVKKLSFLSKRITTQNIALLIGAGALCAAFYQSCLTRQTMHNTQQSFIYSKNINILPAGTKPGIVIDQPYKVMVTFENAGQTPAKGVVLNAEYCVRTGDLPKDFSYPRAPKTQPPSLVGPRREIYHAISIPPSTLLELQLGKKNMFVYGEVLYLDIFNDRHKTEFCQKLAGHMFDKDGTILRYIFTPCDQHNCYDNDCPDNWGKPEVGCASK